MSESRKWHIRGSFNQKCEIAMDIRVNDKIKILSTGIYLPDEKVSSNSLFEEFQSDVKYNIPTNWLSDKVGIEERRFGRSDAVPSDHAIPAAQMAIDNCKDINIDDIDLVIFAGIERDQPEPATAHTIQNALGMKARNAFDISNACFGFVEAIEMASYYIKAGTTDYALIVTGEISSQVARQVVDDLKQGMDTPTAKKILGALTVGDAGGAVIIGKSFGFARSGFDLFNKHVDSSHIDKCIYRHGKSGRFEGQMLMGPISNQIVKQHGELNPDTLGLLGWDAPDWVISHQMGKPPFEKLRRISGVSNEKMIKTFPLLGNITTATFPMNFHKLLENDTVTKGDRVFGYFAGSGLAIGQLGYTV